MVIRISTFHNFVGLWLESTIIIGRSRFIEITAYLDYLKIFQVNMDGSSPSSHGRRDRSIGAFTYDFDGCDHLFCAGIPAWVVRPCRSILIREVVLFQVAEGILPLGLPPKSSLHIPWTRKNPKLSKPFVSIHAVLQADAPLAEPSNREVRQQ